MEIVSVTTIITIERSLPMVARLRDERKLGVGRATSIMAVSIRGVDISSRMRIVTRNKVIGDGVAVDCV